MRAQGGDTTKQKKMTAMTELVTDGREGRGHPIDVVSRTRCVLESRRLLSCSSRAAAKAMPRGAHAKPRKSSAARSDNPDHL